MSLPSLARPFHLSGSGSLRHAAVRTGWGVFTLVADDAALTAVHYPGVEAATPGLWGARVALDDHPVLAEAALQLVDFLAGRRRGFDLPLRPSGTDFQLLVWASLLAIPYGQTRSYGQQAAALGRPTAVRAVGAANSRNPLPIVVPCHRVVGSGGALTGYAGGVTLKARLLDLEAGRGSLDSLDSVYLGAAGAEPVRSTGAGRASR
jgi:methylated-DNA-[protein]-cysteine S-methyltransferase